MSAPVVSIRNLSHAFGALTVLHELSLDIEPGEYLVLLGPSGSGKTTLLSILGGFLQPTKGEVLIDGRDCTRMPPAKRPTTTVFQDYALFPHMSVGANVAFGLRMNGVAKTERARQARETLALVGLEQALDKKPHQLSGGQRQRVALARALVMKPRLLLLDEPLGALDLGLRRQMQDELKAIQKRVGTAFVHVTHDQEEAMALADVLLVMQDGRIVDQGDPERVYTRPSTRFSATFMGENTLIDAEVTGVTGTAATLRTALGTLAFDRSGIRAGKATLMIRPENIRLGAAPPGHVSLGAGEVVESVFQGSYRKVAVRTASGQDIVLKLPVDVPAWFGEPVEMHAAPHHIGLLQE
ncbi:MAG: ABC transporter ATP-binding protein [Mesorhizobium sp.]